MDLLSPSEFAGIVQNNKTDMILKFIEMQQGNIVLIGN